MKPSNINKTLLGLHKTDFIWKYPKKKKMPFWNSLEGFFVCWANSMLINYRIKFNYLFNFIVYENVSPSQLTFDSSMLLIDYTSLKINWCRKWINLINSCWKSFWLCNALKCLWVSTKKKLLSILKEYVSYVSVG